MRTFDVLIMSGLLTQCIDIFYFYFYIAMSYCTDLVGDHTMAETVSILEQLVEPALYDVVTFW